MKYKINVILDETYDDIEADSEEEAFIIASDAAIAGGCWEHYILSKEETDEE